MIRNLKVLGLALTAVLAMSAVAASAASAQTEFHSEIEPTTLTGTQGATVDKFTTTAGSAECKKVTYHGVVDKKTTSTVSVAPSYSECTVFGLPGTIHTNGCAYLFHVDPGNQNVTTGTVDVACPPGQEITLTAGSPTVKCTAHVGSQTGLGTVTFSNVGATPPRTVHVAVDITGIAYSHTKGTGLGSCPSGSGTTGSYVGTGLVSGEDANGTEVDIFVG